MIQEYTVIFLTTQDKVLLGKRKRGLGIGNHVGIGGKVETGENIRQAAVREFREETEVSIISEDLIDSGIVAFYFPHKKGSWDQKVHIFLANEYKGEPQETEEVVPIWVRKDTLPLEQMWGDASYWIPQILDGKKIEAEFIFDQDLKVKGYIVNLI